ncbi:hypothetical protein [Frankia sp. AgB32]|uniref:hypothetical protein n=1 Tax=Frankia sp. AgB32 TaxID=631119 RepID=UPI00200F9A33|nr:hypothetical protein [Frankia sp. AgB32]MCK9894064.1 hypothetical protein [Frankia sp. AgB32]
MSDSADRADGGSSRLRWIPDPRDPDPRSPLPRTLAPGRRGFGLAVRGGRRGTGRRRGGALLAAAGALASLLAATAPPALAAPANPSTPAAGAGGTPAGTVGRVGSYLTDDQHRTVIIRGVAVPAGVTPTGQDLDAWVAAGLTGVRVAVPVASGGRFPAVAGWPLPAAGGADIDPGLAQAAALTHTFTGRGLRVVVRLVPAAGRTASVSTLTAGLARLADRFRDEPGLLGYEVSTGAAARAGDAVLSDAVAAHDPHHLLWRQRAAPFDAAATVAVNDPTGYLTGWKDGSAAALDGLAGAADAFGLSWFYDPPSSTGGTVGTDPPGATGGGSVPSVPAQLVRPYPEAVAGTPEAARLDAARVLTVDYRPVAPDGAAVPAGAATAISVPGAAYPGGYQARVSGGRVISAAGAGLVCVVALPGASRVEVQISPVTGGLVSPPVTAGPAGCAPAAPAGGVHTTGAGAAVADAARGDAADRSYSGPLLWVLPLAGAAVTAGALAAVLRPWRRRQARSGGD